MLVVGTATGNSDGTYTATGITKRYLDNKWTSINAQMAAREPPITLSVEQKVALNASFIPDAIASAQALYDTLTIDAEVDAGTFNVSTVAVTGTGTIA